MPGAAGLPGAVHRRVAGHGGLSPGRHTAGTRVRGGKQGWLGFSAGTGVQWHVQIWVGQKNGRISGKNS